MLCFYWPEQDKNERLSLGLSSQKQSRNASVSYEVGRQKQRLKRGQKRRPEKCYPLCQA